jgi:hypothetical protein
MANGVVAVSRFGLLFPQWTLILPPPTHDWTPENSSKSGSCPIRSKPCFSMVFCHFGKVLLDGCSAHAGSVHGVSFSLRCPNRVVLSASFKELTSDGQALMIRLNRCSAGRLRNSKLEITGDTAQMYEIWSC